jgi:hypothetical protein
LSACYEEEKKVGGRDGKYGVGAGVGVGAGWRKSAETADFTGLGKGSQQHSMQVTHQRFMDAKSESDACLDVNAVKHAMGKMDGG